jgi:hypothetical protein
MTYDKLSIGQRVFNRGDMANIEHFGTITKIIPPGRFSDQIEITPDEESDRDKPYFISSCMISDVDKGNGSTRFVTKEAYDARIKVYIDRMAVTNA